MWAFGCAGGGAEILGMWVERVFSFSLPRLGNPLGEVLPDAAFCCVDMIVLAFAKQTKQTIFASLSISNNNLNCLRILNGQIRFYEWANLVSPLPTEHLAVTR